MNSRVDGVALQERDDRAVAARSARRSAGTKCGFGRQRTSNTRSASTGTPCLNPKLRSVTTSCARGAVARQPHEEAAAARAPSCPTCRRSRRPCARIGVQPRALVADPLADRSVRRQRMRPPRLAEPPHQRVVARLEEDQHRVRAAASSAAVGRSRGNDDEESAFAHVDDDRRPSSMSPPARSDSFGQRRNERRRQVVDAEVAEVLERADRLRLARARQAR